MPSKERNQGYECASYAYECVKQVVGKLFEIPYASEVKQTAARLHYAGLLQTVTYFCSKMREHPHFAYLTVHILANVVRDQVKPQSLLDDNEARNAATNLYSELKDKTRDSASLMYFMERAQAVIPWFQRFAAMQLKGKDQSESKIT